MKRAALNLDFHGSWEPKHPVRESLRFLPSRMLMVTACSPFISIIPVHHFRNLSYQKKERRLTKWVLLVHASLYSYTLVQEV